MSLYELVYDISWKIVDVVPRTRCKHGFGSCDICGTRDSSDVIHSRRTPNKRDARRLRRKEKSK